MSKHKQAQQSKYDEYVKWYFREEQFDDITSTIAELYVRGGYCGMVEQVGQGVINTYSGLGFEVPFNETDFSRAMRKLELSVGIVRPN